METKAGIIEEYGKDRLRVIDIAEEYGVDIVTVYNIIHSEGIKMRAA